MLASDERNGDENLWVRFYRHAVQNNFKSEQAGHPVFDDQDFISIIIPGDPNNIVERKASEADKERFPRQWARYQNGVKESVDGWPLEQWSTLTPAQVNELKHMGFATVEHIAGCSDAQAQKMNGLMGLREKAKAALAVAKDQAAAQKYAAENAALRSEIEDLRVQMKALADEFESLKREKGARKTA